jgi:ribosomal peptide maturation radical SAM protein 1
VVQRTVLVAMPWPYLHMPSMQLGTVTAILRNAGVPVRAYSAYLRFMDFLVEESNRLPPERQLTAQLYTDVSEKSSVNGLGDWVFAVEPFCARSPEREAEYLRYLEGRVDERLIEAARYLRERVGTYLDRCVEEILADDPAVVGFTSTFNQNVPSLNLAARLKAAKPELVIVFGGANCDGPMGAGLHEAFPQIDYVVRGEAEYALPATMEVIAGLREAASVPGLVYRRAGRTVVNPAPRAAAVAMDDVPPPDFDEYFERVRESRVRGWIESLVRIPVESSRGCWWGEKHHCTFCGLNDAQIAYRSKRPDVFSAELEELGRRYRRTRFQVVDYILDLRYFKTLLPWLRETREGGQDWTFFYETKANLKKEQFALLRDAGVHSIQPGIESLSTHVLKLMDKGVTALQNIRALKWAREYGIRVSWNLLYGFAGETAADYERIHELIPLLTHLEPPSSVTRLYLERFSPYFERAEEYGIEVRGPAKFYRLIYPAGDELLARIAYEFEYFVKDLEPNPMIKPLHARVARLWSESAPPSTLTLVRGAGFVTIYDRRAGLPAQDLTLTGTSATIYLELDAGRTPEQLADALGGAVGTAAIRELLDELVRKRLVYEENGVYLALAVALRPVLARRTVPPLRAQPAGEAMRLVSV